MPLEVTNLESVSKSAWDPTDAAHVLILAGGDGVRLRPLTRALTGDDRPKQFCTLVGEESLLAQTLRRAALLVPRERTQCRPDAAPRTVLSRDRRGSSHFLARRPTGESRNRDGGPLRAPARRRAKGSGPPRRPSVRSLGVRRRRIHRELPAADLSRDVLATRPEALAVLRVAGVGWDDVTSLRALRGIYT